MSPSSLRALLAGPDIVVAPGAYDALSARLVEAAGFRCVYMSGFATTAGRLAQPDIGLLTQSEMVDNARAIASAVSVPVVADADNGYGNPLNVMRTVRDYERAGVAGIHLEDQVMPKRCGHMAGKAVVSEADMVAKVRAAVEARTDPAFVLIARTDARAPEGLDAALRRARAYADAGADVLFVEAPQTEEEVVAVARALRDVPLLFNWAEGGLTPPLPLPRLRELGFRLVIFPIGALLAAATGMRRYLDVLQRDGTPDAALGDLPSLAEFADFLGLQEVRAVEQRFATESSDGRTHP